MDEEEEIKRFEQALAHHKRAEGVHPLLDHAMIDGLQAQLDDLRALYEGLASPPDGLKGDHENAHEGTP